MAKKKRRNYIIGRLQTHKKGFGFVVPEEVTDLNHINIADIYIDNYKKLISL